MWLNAKHPQQGELLAVIAMYKNMVQDYRALPTLMDDKAGS